MSCLTAEDSKLQMAVEFDLIWDIYPKRVNPKEAIECYRARRKEGVDFRTLFLAVLAYKEERRGEPAKYTMQGKVFFGTNERWKDFDGKQTNGSTRKRKDGKWEPPMKNLQELAKRDQAERDAMNQPTPEAPTTDPSPTTRTVDERLSDL